MTLADSNIRLETRTDRSGRLELKLPAEFADSDVVVSVTRQPRKVHRASTREEYRAFIEGVFGKCDDPTFVPPPDQPMPPIEPL